MARSATGLLLLAGAALFLFPRMSAQAMTSVPDQDTSDAPGPEDTNADSVALTSNAFPDTWGYDMGDVMQAFLWMIRCCEHLYPQNVDNDACYGIFYGGQTFTDFSDHPVITGACHPVPLADATCRAAGLNPGCVSTGAGAYQIIKPTWTAIRSQGTYLSDFSPASQDAAAVRLLAQCGASPLIQAGNIAGAVAKASKVWASLPGATTQQHPKLVAFASTVFNEGLANAVQASGNALPDIQF